MMLMSNIHTLLFLISRMLQFNSDVIYLHYFIVLRREAISRQRFFCDGRHFISPPWQ